MSNIRILVKGPVLTGTGITHTATSWEIAKLPDFSVSANILNRSLASTANKLEYKVSIDLDELNLDTVYVRTKYHYSSGATSDWSKIVNLKGDQKGLKFSNTIIRTPRVTIVKNKDSYELSTNAFKMFSGPGVHHSTSWWVSDLTGNTVMSRLKDEDNLTSYTLPIELFKSGVTYIIHATHHTDTNGDSYDGKCFYVIKEQDTSSFTLDMIGDFVAGRKITFDFKSATPLASSVDIFVVNTGDNTIFEFNGLTGTSPVIDTAVLTQGDVYRVQARLNYTNGDKSLFRNIYTGVLKPNYLIAVTGYLPYVGKYSYFGSRINNGIANVVSSEMYDGKVIHGKSGATTLEISEITQPANNLVYVKTQSIGSDTLTGIANLHVLPLHTGEVVINYRKSGGSNIGESIWSKYKYDPVQITIGGIGTYSNPKHKLSTSICASAAVMDNDDIYYIPAREVDSNGNYINLSLYKLDTVTMTSTLVKALPFNAKGYVSLVRTGDNNLIILGGTTNVDVDDTSSLVRTNNNIYRYTIASNSFATIGNINSVPVNAYAYQGFLRKDGQIVYFNSVQGGTSVGDSRTILVNPSSGSSTIENNDHDTDLPIANSIVLKNGDIIRTSSYVHDVQQMHKYICGSMDADEVVVRTTVDSIDNDLVVGVNESVRIESPYKYTTIVISTGGTLTWTDLDGAHNVFTSDDLIITRDTIMPQATYDAGNWENVYVLDGATFLISN